MSNAIYYRFRSQQVFEKVSFPGSVVRLFDVKKAIVKAKKLDSGRVMDFDLEISNADNGGKYHDEANLIRMGTRLIIARIPAARRNGLLHRIARDECATTLVDPLSNCVVPEGFYTIDGRDNDEEEYVTTSSNDESSSCEKVDKDLEEIDPLYRAIAAASTKPATSHPNPLQRTHKPNPSTAKQTYNADPSLREFQKMIRSDRWIKGVPRQFRSLAEGTNTGAKCIITPDNQAFKQLVNETTGRSFEIKTALKVTQTKVPEFLVCGVCQDLLRDPVCLHWDDEGRSACSSCMREALSRQMKCPVTGVNDISPDDLQLNKPIQKAVVAFIERLKVIYLDIQKQTDKTATGRAKSQSEPCEERSKAVPETIRSSKKDKADDEEFGGDVFVLEPDNATKKKTVEQSKSREKVEQGTVLVDQQKVNTTNSFHPDKKSNTHDNRFVGSYTQKSQLNKSRLATVDAAMRHHLSYQKVSAL